ncbi:MAG: hypothetical protein HQL47_05765 [Gammaproteobacteria bacterium]|nr:hypothetical protein [Gammaproteobacteria bacterium]
MNIQSKYTRCGTCEHALITGIACDSGPSDCAQFDNLKAVRQMRPSLPPLHLVAKTMALPHEYDAVRGID